LHTARIEIDDPRPLDAKPWTESVIDGAVARAARLHLLARDVSSFQGNLAASMTTRVNLRLQRWIAVLTVGLLAITVATLIVTAVAARHDLDPLWNLLPGR
jgi:hypothetical protein